MGALEFLENQPSGGSLAACPKTPDCSSQRSVRSAGSFETRLGEIQNTRIGAAVSRRYNLWDDLEDAAEEAELVAAGSGAEVPGDPDFSSRAATDAGGSSSLMPEWIRDEEPLQETDDEDYAEISAIIDCKESEGGRSFKVQFRSNKEFAWIQEADMDGCVTSLENFCSKNNLARPELNHRQGGGSADPSQANTSNWVSLQQIL